MTMAIETWTAGPLEVASETGECGERSPILSVVEGYNALFGYRVAGVPAYSGMAMAAGMSPTDWAARLLVRQADFLVGFHATHSRREEDSCAPTLQMRLVASGEGDVQILVLGKAFGPSKRRARWLAEELASEISLLFPKDFCLVPLAEREVPCAPCGPLAEDGNGWWGCEIRRREEFVVMERENQVWEKDYLLYPFGWSAEGLVDLVRVMAARHRPALLAVTIRPTTLYEREERLLGKLCANFAALEHAARLGVQVQARLGRDLWARYFMRLKRPFVMRAQLAGEGPPGSLVGAAARAVSGVPERHLDDEHAMAHAVAAYSAGCEITFPRSEEPADWETYRDNLQHLDVEHWGEDLAVGGHRRLRYLTDAIGATSLFRVPILPAELAEELGLEMTIP